MIKALKTSVVVPARNEEAYLGACIESLLAQNIPFDQIIIVENASTDATHAIAKGYAKHNANVTVLKEAVVGRHTAQATGFAFATAEWIVRIDADTRLAPDWHERLLLHIARKPDVSAWTGRAIFYDSAAPKIAGYLQALMYQYLQFPAARTWTLWGSAMAVRRTDMPRITLPDELLNTLDEDIITTLLLKAAGKKCQYSTDLHAFASLRRGETSVADAREYLKTWPADYKAVGRHIAAKYVNMLSFVVLVGAVLNAASTKIMPSKHG